MQTASKTVTISLMISPLRGRANGERRKHARSRLFRTVVTHPSVRQAVSYIYDYK
jgi:hypothetical protein